VCNRHGQKQHQVAVRGWAVGILLLRGMFLSKIQKKFGRCGGGFSLQGGVVRRLIARRYLPQICASTWATVCLPWWGLGKGTGLQRSGGRCLLPTGGVAGANSLRYAHCQGGQILLWGMGINQPGVHRARRVVGSIPVADTVVLIFATH
jgi:hypothetical protein